MDCTSKQAGRVVACGCNLQHAFENPTRIINRQGFPGRLAPGKDGRSVELNVLWIGRIRSSELINFAAEPVNLGFENTYAAEDKLLFSDIAWRTGIVQIEEIHKKSSRVNFRSADRRTALSTANQ